MTNTLFDALFAPHVGNDTRFLIDEQQKITTHAEFLNLANKITHALTASGLRVGDRVAVQIEKSIYGLAIYAACVQGGFVFLPLNTAYTASEVSYFVRDSGARVLIGDYQREGALATLAQDLGVELLSVDAKGDQGSLNQATEKADISFNPVPRAPNDLAAILYTSGTTGRSKGAMISHQNLVSNARALQEAWRFSKRDVLLHALPIFHTHGLFVATNIMLLCGGSMIFHKRFDLDLMFKSFGEATSMMGVPTFYTRLLSDDRLTQDAVSNMRVFISGSAPLLAETHSQFESKTGHRILERYGMTETNMNTTNPYEGERRAGTVGFPLSGVELKITDPETGKALPKGEIGLIEVRGENVFQGYWNMPEKTKEDLREDGFFITGDLAKYDADGYVTIVGRQKDLIISGGFNVYPKEIETVLDDQADVKESAVVGLEHPDFGEGVVAFVVMQEWAEVNEDQLIAALGQELAKYKTPKRIIALEELPRNTMGKVQKNVLRDGYRELFLN